MTCDEFRELTSGQKELTEPLEEAYSQHMANCTSCQVDGRKELDTLMAELRPALKPYFDAIKAAGIEITPECQPLRCGGYMSMFLDIDSTDQERSKARAHVKSCTFCQHMISYYQQ